MNASIRALRGVGAITAVEDPARLKARLATAVWGAGMGLWEIDLLNDCTRWFSDWCDRLNLDPCDGRDHVARWDANVHPDDLEDASRRFNAHLAGEEDHYDAEYRIRDNTGRWRWLFERGRVVERAPDGAAVRMVGVCMDIDARKGAELDLVKSRKRLEVAFESARGGLWDLDVEAGEPCHTEFYYRMLGFDQVGRGRMSEVWSNRLHPDDRARVCEALQRTIDGTCDLYEAEYRLRHADGSWRWVLDRGRALERDADGRALRLVGFIIETSDPHSLEREIIESANRERQRIGNDLHDGLGQELTGIALMLRAIGAQLRKESSAACPDIEDVIGLVNVAIENTRALARGLSPVSPERNGLTAALRSLAARATERYGVPVRFDDRGAERLPVDEKAATHLYRIAQEALTNAMRHGLATTVRIRLHLTPSMVILEVSDDGNGFSAEALAESDGLGLKIMRYRAQMLGGRLDLETSMAGGATVRCLCPISREAQAAASTS